MIFDLSDEDRHLIAVALFERTKILLWNTPILQEGKYSLSALTEFARLKLEAKRCSALADLISPKPKKGDVA